MDLTSPPNPLPVSGRGSNYLRGLVTSSQSGFYTVQTEAGALVCRVRGRLKHAVRNEDIVAIGDRVEVTRLDGRSGVIEAVTPRSRSISRLSPTPGGQFRQIIIANPDQMVFVFACAQPDPHLRMLDRFLVEAERQAVPAVIVANKVDLVGVERAEQTFGHYAMIGYSLIYTSTKSGLGIVALRQKLAGAITALAGPSGAGKTSLMNALQPGLGLAVRQISQSTGKGRHTTVTSQLFPLEGGGYVADTPGLKALALWDIEAEELDAYFPEISPLVAECQFSDCTHRHEPGCAVKAAVARGEVHPERYESYIRMRAGEEV